MWRKPEDSKLKSAPSTSAPPEPSTISPGAQSAQAVSTSVPPASVNQGIVIKGEITGRGDFFLDGDFEGKVCLADGAFTVGRNARVEAEIEAREIIIHGEVIGSLKARERVKILSTAKVTGNMDTRGIVIEDGAVLHSKVAVPRSASQPPASAAPSEAPARTKGAAVGATAEASSQEETAQ